ncbi:hypothetical protein ACTMTI_06385 [Nonomuraea sp. H19]|uniref:hypothetical protein n=1 Tax=Nonomuraea sp. H19 TaxID=3452206 RepID=UPI003F8BE1F3
MRNGVRHLLGVGVGLLATPVIAAGLAYGSADRFMPRAAIDWIALAPFIAAVVVVGVLAGSRLSPLASLLPGLAFTGIWVAVLVRMGRGGDGRLWYEFVPDQYLGGYTTLLHTWSPAIGCVLLAASLFPARWRAAAKPASRPAAEPVPPPEEVPVPPPLPKRIPSRH